MAAASGRLTPPGAGRRQRGPVALLAAGFVLAWAALAAAPPARAGLLVTANDDAYTGGHDAVLTVAAPGVLANDSGVVPTAAKLTNPAHGTVTVSANGSITYRPAAGYIGTDHFTYEARVLSLGLLVTDSATVTLTITNGAPVAVADAYSAVSGVQLSVAAPGVLANDTDADGDPLTAILVDGGGTGSLDLNANGSFTFTSGGSFVGDRTFTYRASDGIASSNVATVTIHVAAKPAPTPTPTPSASPTAAPTPTPAATPSPTPRPTLPLPSLPLPSLEPLPSVVIVPTPTPRPSVIPSARPSDSPAPSAGPSAAASPPPGPGTIGGIGGPPPSGGSGGAGGDPAGPGAARPPFEVGPLDGPPIDGLDLGDVGVVGIDTIVEWAVPSLVLGVPGILLILAVGAQVLGGLFWVPVVRRWLAGIGVRRREASAS